MTTCPFLRSALALSGCSGLIVMALACGGLGDSPPPADSPSPTPAATTPAAEPEAEPPEINEAEENTDEEAPWLSIVPRNQPILEKEEPRPICQPESFVPGEDRIVEDASNPDFDLLAADDPEDGWRGVRTIDWADQLTLPAGMSVKGWYFECVPNPSFNDQVLEIRQDGVRKALFTHIRDVEASPDGTRIYFINLVRSGAGWTRKARVLDLKSFKAIELQPRDCNAYGGTDWLDGFLVTSTGYSEWTLHGDLCLWTDQGELVQHVRYRHSMMGLGSPAVRPGPRPIATIGSVEPCGLAAIDLRSGEIRWLAREQGPDENGFLKCVEVPEDIGVFSSFGEPMPE